MVVSDKYGAGPRPGIGRRTAIYVASFGLGSLLIAGTLSLALVSAAEAVLPPRGAGATQAPPESVKIIGRPTHNAKPNRATRPRKGSKAHSDRANEAAKSRRPR